MLNRRYLMPAMIAVALHAILLWGIRGQAVIVVIPPPEKPPSVRPPVPVDLMAFEPADSSENTGPAPSGEPVAALPETPVMPRDDGFAPIPVIERPPVISGPLKAIPTTWHLPGSGEGEDGGTGARIFPPDMLDSAPRAKLQAAPFYPPELRHSGVEGRVLVEFAVDVHGSVTHAAVRESTQWEFEEPTLRAVYKWRFEPGRRNGRVVPFRMVVPVHFRLDPL